MIWFLDEMKRGIDTGYFEKECNIIPDQMNNQLNFVLIEKIMHYSLSKKNVTTPK